MICLFLLIPLFSSFLLFTLVAVLGFVAAFLPPSVFALPAEILDQKSAGLGYGVLNTCLNAGIITGPFLVGVSIDLTAKPVVAFFLMALFSLVAFLLVLGLKTR